MSKPRGSTSYSEAFQAEEEPDPCEVPMSSLLSDPPDAPPRMLTPPGSPPDSLMGGPDQDNFQSPIGRAIGSPINVHSSPHVTQLPSPEDAEYATASNSRSEPQTHAGLNRCVGSSRSKAVQAEEVPDSFPDSFKFLLYSLFRDPRKEYAAGFKDGYAKRVAEGVSSSSSEPQMHAGSNRCVGSSTLRSADVLMKAGQEIEENGRIATARSEGGPNANNVGVATAQSTTGQNNEEIATTFMSEPRGPMSYSEAVQAEAPAEEVPDSYNLVPADGLLSDTSAGLRPETTIVSNGPWGLKSFSEVVQAEEVPESYQVPTGRLLSDPPNAHPRTLTISPPDQGWSRVEAEHNSLLGVPGQRKIRSSPHVTQPPSVEYAVGASSSRSKPHMHAGSSRCVGGSTSRSAGVLTKAGQEKKENLRIATARSKGRSNASNVGVATAKSTTGQKNQEKAEVARGLHSEAPILTRRAFPNRFGCLSDEGRVSQLLSQEPSRVEKQKGHANLKENEKKWPRNQSGGPPKFPASSRSKKQVLPGVSLGQGQNGDKRKREKEENGIRSGPTSQRASESGLHKSNKKGSGNGPTSSKSRLDRSKKNGNGNESSSKAGVDTSLVLGSLTFITSITFITLLHLILQEVLFPSIQENVNAW